MNGTHGRLWRFWTLLVLSLVMGQSALTYGQSVDERTSSHLFEAIIDSWKSSSFACRYEMRQGVIVLRARDGADLPLPAGVKSFEEIPADASPEFVLDSARITGTASGVLCKEKELVHLSRNPVADAKHDVLTRHDGVRSSVVTDSRHEYLSNSIMRISYVHDGQLTSYGRADINPRSADELCGYPIAVISPISPMMTCDHSMAFMLGTQPSHEKWDDSVDGVLTLERHFSIPQDNSSLIVERIDSCSVKQGRPFLLEMQIASFTVSDTEDSKSAISTNRIVMSDHVDCGDGVFLPKRIVSVSRIDQSPPIIYTKEWTSQDLGDRHPREEDFVIEVKGDDDTIGFTDRSIRRFTPEHLDPRFCAASGKPIMAPTAPPKEVVPHSKSSRYFIWTNLFALIALAIYAVRRGRAGTPKL